MKLLIMAAIGAVICVVGMLCVYHISREERFSESEWPEPTELEGEALSPENELLRSEPGSSYKHSYNDAQKARKGKSYTSNQTLNGENMNVTNHGV